MRIEDEEGKVGGGGGSVEYGEMVVCGVDKESVYDGL